MTENDVYSIWFSLAKTIPNRRNLIDRYPSAQVLFDDVQYEMKLQDYETAKRIEEQCIKNHIELLGWQQIKETHGLSAIKSLPYVIYYKGTWEKKERYAAIVGARRCTQDGKLRTVELTKQLVQKETAIVSGLAKGIDSYAHTQCLLSGGYTIAVLGCGLDICYPREHNKLMQSIMENGLLISEYPPMTPPRTYYFPKRNRLIAALSDEIYVIEAGRKSGSLITAKYGEQYGRQVYFCYK